MITEMSNPPIAIVGAGLSGLTLGLCLKHKGIAATIYDSAALSAPRHRYGITVHRSTYRPLLSVLGIDEDTIKDTVAMGIGIKGRSDLSSTSLARARSLRCHRGQLEALLGKELSIERGTKLVDIKRPHHQSQEKILIFEDGSSHTATCLVGCDGPHSQIRQSLNSSLKLRVLPYVVYNGRRRFTHSTYAKLLQPYMQDNALLHTRKGTTRLEIAINNVTEAHVDVGYTYSRPVHQPNDPLHKPDRPNSNAIYIDKLFYKELAALGSLDPPFDNIFKVHKVRDDMMLHWLMRSITPEAEELKRLAGEGVVLIGDAAHAAPILGGDGANVAIQDGIELAEYIAANGTAGLEGFVQQRHKAWQKSVKESERNIADIHS